MRHSHLVGALISAFVLAFASLASAQNTVQYVDGQLMTGANNGTSWLNAFRSFDRALDPAQNPEIQLFLNVELHLKGGTYIPNGALMFPSTATMPREAAFVVPDGVAQITGGYKGSEGISDPPIGPPTVLSGDRGTLGASGDNCYHVLVFDENIVSTRLDGVIVEDGNADFLPQLPMLPTPQTNNSFGAGILIDGVEVWCTDVRVRDCFASLGGGIGVRQSLTTGGGGQFRGRRITIRDNLAGMTGAGFYVANGSVAVIGNSTFRGNVSGGDAGAIFVGELVIDFELNNSRVFDNAARGLGGGALIASRQTGTQGGARFINCTIAHNKANSGSGLYFMAGPAALNSRLVQNTILFQNPSGTNNDNIVSLGSFIVDISNSFLGTRNQNPVQSIAPTTTGSFIDAAGTTLVPGWWNESARNFKLVVNSVCIDQGADSLLTMDRLDIEDDLNFIEDLPREYFMFDEAQISSADSTREVDVLGAGTLPPGGNIGVDNLSGSVPGPICDIGAHEYRDPQPINP